MPAFTVRVELHGVSDYSNLHTEMRKEKFLTTITGDSGIDYHLPTAEYNLPNGIDADAGLVLARATRAVVAALKNELQTIKDKNKAPTIFVTTAGNRKWSGLKKV